MFPWTVPEGGDAATTGSRKHMLEERAAKNKNEGLAFERKPRDAVRYVQKLGADGCYQEKVNPRKGQPAKSAPNPSPKLPARDNIIIKKKMPVDAALLAPRSPYQTPEDRFLHTKPRPLFGACNGKSLLDEASGAMYSSFSRDARFNLPPLPKLSK